MAGSYKVVFKEKYDPGHENSLTWEQGSPLCMRAVQVSRNTETAETYLQAKALNIADKAVGEVHARATIQYQDGLSETLDLDDLDADVGVGSEYTFRPISLSQPDVLRADVQIVKATLGDGTAWETAGGPSPVVLGDSIDLSPSYQSTRDSCLEKCGCRDVKSAIHKVVERDGYWVCSCGQVNLAEACANCKIDRREAKQCESIEFLGRVASLKEEEEAKAALEKQQVKNRAKRIGIVVGVVLGVLVAASLIVPQVVRLLGVGGVYVPVKYSYVDSDGKEHLTEYEIDENGNKLKTKEIKPEQSTYTYKVDSYGTVTECTGGKYPYKRRVDSVDTHGQPTKITSTDSDGAVDTYEIEWYGEGHVKQVIYRSPSIEYTRTIKYNEQGEETKSESTFANTRYKYVSADHFTTDYKYEYDSDGKVSSCEMKDEDGKTTTQKFEYDEHGNVKRITEGDRVVAEYEYAYVASPSPYVKMCGNLLFKGNPF